MELYEAVSRCMGIPEVVIRGSMGYMRQSRIFVVTFLGILDPVQRILSTPQVQAGETCARRDLTDRVILWCRVPFPVQTWRRL